VEARCDRTVHTCPGPALGGGGAVPTGAWGRWKNEPDVWAPRWLYLFLILLTSKPILGIGKMARYIENPRKILNID
jgi:hypothetical protein